MRTRAPGFAACGLQVFAGCGGSTACSGRCCHKRGTLDAKGFTVRLVCGLTLLLLFLFVAETLCVTGVADVSTPVLDVLALVSSPAVCAGRVRGRVFLGLLLFVLLLFLFVAKTLCVTGIADVAAPVLDVFALVSPPAVCAGRVLLRRYGLFCRRRRRHGLRFGDLLGRLFGR